MVLMIWAHRFSKSYSLIKYHLWRHSCFHSNKSPLNILFKIWVFSKLSVMSFVFQNLQYSLLSLRISKNYIIEVFELHFSKKIKIILSQSFFLHFFCPTRKAALHVTKIYSKLGFHFQTNPMAHWTWEVIFYWKMLHVCSLTNYIFNAKIRLWSNPRECEHSL